MNLTADETRLEIFNQEQQGPIHILTVRWGLETAGIGRKDEFPESQDMTFTQQKIPHAGRFHELS